MKKILILLTLLMTTTFVFANNLNEKDLDNSKTKILPPLTNNISISKSSSRVYIYEVTLSCGIILEVVVSCGCSPADAYDAAIISADIQNAYLCPGYPADPKIKLLAPMPGGPY